MTIEKVLNNNTIVSIDPKTKKEVILVGCGIAFNKRVGQEVDEERIEKTFIIENKRVGNKLKKLIIRVITMKAASTSYCGFSFMFFITSGNYYCGPTP